jgi:tRNA A-37 threonylcarbamoyl transferase component Bud32
MQCIMSHSDPGSPEVEEGGTIAHTNLPAVPTPAELAPHFPELEILELLGQGGMGAVYKARQKKLDRLVAIKILPPEWSSDPAFAERFAREARALARLNHPHVVSVHDFGEAGGQCFLIMEYVDGANLRQILATGRLQPPQALPIVAQVCDALQYAHEQDIVHRDIKPENILVDKRGRVKIADFGLAKLLRRSRNELTLTGSRQVMGTLDYMAPEQRATPQAVDHRADIYSLGVVFYEMLTGELPLGRFAPPSEKAPVDGRLDEVVFRALEREPDRRYQRISAVKADVESILRAESWRPGLAGTLGSWEPDLAMVQLQTRGPAAGMFVVALLILIQGAVLAFLAQQWNWGEAMALLAIPIVAVAGFLFAGAVNLARCRGYEWVMIATLLMLLPLGYHFFLGLPIGIWTLRVLRRAEVKAAFAHNLRRALRAWQVAAAPAVAEPSAVQPAAPTPGKLGGFFLSMFSMFAPRSVLQQPPAAEDAVLTGDSAGNASPALANVPRRKPKPRKRSRVAIWLGFGLVLCAGMSLLFLTYMSQRGEVATTQPDVVLEGLRVDFSELCTRLQLVGHQPQALAEILRHADQEYLELEARHTSRQVDDEGHLHVTIAPFIQELTELGQRLEALLQRMRNDRWGQPAEGKMDPSQSAAFKLFPYGAVQTSIEIWQEDGWYHWKEKLNGGLLNFIRSPAEGDGKQLPRAYQRFWRNRPPERDWRMKSAGKKMDK